LNDLSIRQRLHSHGFLMAINAIILMLISTRYFSFLPAFPESSLAIVFIIISVISHMMLLAGLVTLVTIPTIFLPRLIRILTQALIATIGVATLLNDTMVFAQYRFHINAIVVDLVMSDDVVVFPLTMWISAFAVLTALFIFQFLLISKLEKIIVNDQPKPRNKFFRFYSMFFFISLLCSHGIHVWAAAQAYQPVTMVKRYLPLFYPATSNRTMAKYGFVDREAIKRQKEMKLTRKSDLKYPLKPIQADSISKPVNIMIIMVDSWRADTFTEGNTPAMWHYAQKGLVFENHLSSGNATRIGVFGLFYGLPGTYWHSVMANTRTPVLMDRIQSLGYDTGIFAAAKLTNPEFDQTIFNGIKNLRIRSKGKSPYKRDKNLTDDWLTWDQQRDKTKPAFSFLFYDAPHGYDFPKDYPHQYHPMADEVNYLELDNDFDPKLLLNRYKTSVHYADSQVKRVLEQLEKSGQLDNTVVIITGDHGQEINDNKLNFWGHNSNYTKPQIQVPLAIFGPGIKAEPNQWGADKFTAHQDIAPTLMKNYLGVSNEISDYSTGVDLFAAPLKRDWVIAAKYSGYALVTDNYIVEIGAGGNYQILDQQNRPSKEELNFQYMEAAFKQISLYSE